MAFTSIKTTGGWSTNTVQAAYDKLFGWDLKSATIMAPFVDVEPKQPTSKGSSITLNINAYFSRTSVVAAKTALDEETDVTPTKLPATSTVTLTPVERGFVVQRTDYLDDRSLVPVDPVISRAVATHSAEVHDDLILDELRAQTTNIIYGGGVAGTASIAGTNIAKSSDLRHAHTILRTGNAAPWDGQFYVLILHPHIIHDLREETGSGSWRVPKEYTDPGNLYNGEFGQWEGFRVISYDKLYRPESDTDGDVATPVFRGFAMGREALAKAVVNAPQMVISPQTDLLRRWAAMGWKSDLDYGVYRTAANVQLQHASSLGAP